ncbi:cyclin-A1-4-like [Capsella rubella]|uniref:cyclin-A1-4-like n=1 Tax=Capsella rubella TaxID=81985 RepID=UPI000CD56B45|nr:cyclin-A1-4-like [Capsella rubella]
MSSPLKKRQRILNSSSEQSEHIDEEHDVATMDLTCNEEQSEDIDQEQDVATMDLTCNEEEMIAELKDAEPIQANEVGINEAREFATLLISQQPEINLITAIDENTRATTIDTMLASEKAAQYPKAIPLAVLVFDKYFASFQVGQGPVPIDPQTAITLSLFIAVKYEYGIDKSESLVFPIRNLELEIQILRSFDYRLSGPTTKTFVDLHLSMTAQHDATFQCLCSYIAELSLLGREFSGFLPSLLAAASVFLAQYVLRQNEKPTTDFVWVYEKGDLRNAVTLLLEIFLQRRYGVCHYIRNKYTSSHFEGVASLPCRDSIPEEFFS